MITNYGAQHISKHGCEATKNTKVFLKELPKNHTSSHLIILLLHNTQDYRLTNA